MNKSLAQDNKTRPEAKATKKRSQFYNKSGQFTGEREGHMYRNLLMGMAVMTLVGCAGRSPQPVAVVQPQDQYTDCTAIMAEVQANNAKVQELASEEGWKTTQNVAAGVAGIFIPVLWFGMDFQGTASK